MDGERFDAMARGLASPAGRRGVLRGLAAGALVAVFGARLTDEAAAATPRCKKTGCGERCRHAVDKQGHACGCALTVDGKSLCIATFCGKACDKDSECPKRSVCTKTAKNCCESKTNKAGLCSPRCQRGTPTVLATSAPLEWTAAD